LKLGSRLPFYVFIVLIVKVTQSFIAVEKFPEDEKTVSCSSHQIPRMLWEYHRIALLRKKVDDRTQCGNAANPCCLSHLSDTSQCHEMFYCCRRFIPVFPEGLSLYQCDGGFTIFTVDVLLVRGLGVLPAF